MIAKKIFILSAIFTITMYCGCKKRSESSSETDGAMPAKQEIMENDNGSYEIVTLDMVIGHWKKKQKDTAVQMLLEGEWRHINDDSIFAYSEQQFIALPVDQQNKLRDQVDASITTTREIVRYMLNIGRKEVSENNVEEAKKIFNAVYELGCFMCEGNRLAIIQALGKGVKRAASREMENL